MRQIARAGCQVHRLKSPQNDRQTAGELCQLADQQGCHWIVADDSRVQLIHSLVPLRPSGRKLLVIGQVELSQIDFQTAGDPRFALVRSNLPIETPARRVPKSSRLRCLLDLSRMGADKSTDLIRQLCHHFADQKVVFDIVTPFSRRVAESLRSQDPVNREFLFWHRNSDRAFQALFAFQVAIASDLATFCETAFAGKPSLLLTETGVPPCLSHDLTTHPWRVDCQGQRWAAATVQWIQRILESPTRRQRHAREMGRLVDDQAALRLCQVLRDATATRMRSA